MAKSKKKRSRGQQQTLGDSKKRKMQHFQRVSISSQTGNSSRATDSQKKRKLADSTIASNQQQQQAWKNKKSEKNTHQQELHQRPVIPYDRKDRILLMGEGDFSFARSLYEHHRCKNVFATCYDSEGTLLSKYHGHAEENIKHFLDQKDIEDVKRDANGAQGKVTEDDTYTKNPEPNSPTRKVLYSVDARKLGTNAGGGKDIRKGIPHARNKKRKRQSFHRNGPQPETNSEDDGGPWDIISFNFPHVGGLSTDVNRQVRANQELLVAFFKACVPLLSRTAREDRDNTDDDDHYDDDSFESETSESESEEDKNIRTIPRQSGQIIVTLFEGEPYTLWNIKDLARHAGLVVATSFKFPWKSYPGYSHARTLGIVESRSSEAANSEETERRGGWKGEDREARSYVFEVKTEYSQRRRPGQQEMKDSRDGGKGNKKRRGRGDESSDED
ncbi:conserved hypothetical protein [Talaromyces stipitatus ATCC 10500]|uniref:25S rRNA (uridine-N(3))-methyltransferase BMT5-like domain-containing protein n=1 Tax=Talaromyces stipitatus (strain ATCC 10500 / CBS 375.48 / QM 6759 / NRRL 1006) TaxID=441959 RepID=B8MC02_TALSN|nr:uncharacterized protein TSTA_121860 [Talaromyces stipitatus ATCC 10500]EED18448.1 conserved hypothetical protein [Talaromyces stipitatus ATCC 10500]